MRIFLLGFPACGKTYLGPAWAAALQLDFRDLDVLMEQEERLPLPEIFSTYSEGYFREKEAAVLRNTDRFDNCLIACGGGTPAFFDNMEWMNRNGLTVFLNALREEIARRLDSDKNNRPLVVAAGGAEKFLDSIWDERLQYYSRAALAIPPAALTADGYRIILNDPRYA